MIYPASANQIKAIAQTGQVWIAVIGLGQVGLPLASAFVRGGLPVIGVDIDAAKLSAIGQSFSSPERGGSGGGVKFTTDATQAAQESQVSIICVPTPLTAGRAPDLTAVKAAARAVGRGLRRGSLVILESTVYPGVTTKVVKPILEGSSGLKAGRDFGLAYCFERIDPGNEEHRIDNTPKVVGAVDAASAEATAAIYSFIVNAPILCVRDCETAELVKLVENVYRDVNIAFVNEIALLCEGLGLDVLEVLEAAATKWSFRPHLPGAGVGGTCIPVNPYYMLHAAASLGMDLKLVRQARVINEAMPQHMVELTRRALEGVGKAVAGAKIVVLGLAYKADIDDKRGSPGEEIARQLTAMGAEVICCDPVVTSAPPGLKVVSSWQEAIKGADCLVIATDHSAFQHLDLKKMAGLAGQPLAIVDGRHVIKPSEAELTGLFYAGLGRNPHSQLSLRDMKPRK